MPLYDNKILFIHIPKTAGTLINSHLCRNLTRNCINTNNGDHYHFQLNIIH